jgi:hypothetical protein
MVVGADFAILWIDFSVACCDVMCRCVASIPENRCSGCHTKTYGNRLERVVPDTGVLRVDSKLVQNLRTCTVLQYPFSVNEYTRHVKGGQRDGLKEYRIYNHYLI